MKLRTRCYLYFGLTGLVPLGIIFLLFLMFWQKQNTISSGWNWSTEGLVVSVVLIALGESATIIELAHLFMKTTINRIVELNNYLRLSFRGGTPELKTEGLNDELSELRQLFFDMYQKMEKAKAELEENCRQLQLSNMNLEEKYAQSYTVRLIQEEISRELDTDQLWKKTLDIIMGVFGSKRCTIYMTDDQKDALVVRADSGFETAAGRMRQIPLDSDNIIARTWRDKRVYSEVDAELDEMVQVKKENSQSFLTLPLKGRGHGCLGVMVIEQECKGGINQDLIDFAKLIAQELGFSVENAYLYGKMREAATHDALTGCFNRVYLMNYITEVFAKSPTTVSVIMFDLDHFKRINDRFGHLAGDLVLKTAASLIQKMLPTGIIARYGGEEFVMVLPEIIQDQAYLLADLIRQVISEYQFIVNDDVTVNITVSAGLANYPLESDSYEGLLQLADEALYVAKNSGRNRVSVAVYDIQSQL